MKIKVIWHKENCPVCKHPTYKEEQGEYYSDGMQISPDEGYCSNCNFRYSQHINHSIEEQIKNHINWLQKMSEIYQKIEVKKNIQLGKYANEILMLDKKVFK